MQTSQLMGCVLCSQWLFFFFFLATPRGMQDLSSLTRDQTLQWKRGVLTTGPPGKSQLSTLFNRLFFRGNLGSLQYWAEVQRFPIYSMPHTSIASPIISIPHQSRPFIRIDEPIFTHHYHPKSVVYIRVHSWCCTLYAFEQIYNDMYPPLQYYSIIQSSFTALKIPWIPPIHSLSVAQILVTTDLLLIPWMCSVTPSTLSFSFNIVLAILNLLPIHINFRNGLSVSTK